MPCAFAALRLCVEASGDWQSANIRRIGDKRSLAFGRAVQQDFPHEATARETLDAP